MSSANWLFVIVLIAASVPLAQTILAQDEGVFEPYPDKADMLIVVAHPDDESTFGGLIPYYAVCQKKQVIFVCLTSGEWGHGMPHHTLATDPPDYSYDDSDYPRFEAVPVDALYPCFYRELELTRALMTMGVNTKPIMPRFKDMSGLQPWGSPEPALELWGGREKTVEFVRSQIDRFKPEVVVTMAANGFNGNPIHAAASRAAVLASQASGGDTPNSWLPRKVYLQVAEGEVYETVHSHSWDLNCNGNLGQARILAARGNVQHESQEMKEVCESSTKFTLIQSSVGPDVVNKDNLFEHLD